MCDMYINSLVYLIGIMCVLCGFLYYPCSSDTYIQTYYTNTCEQSGKALSCDEGYVVKVVDVRCFPHNITCAEREKIARLCDGLHSCARLDLRRQLNYYCKNFPMKNVVTTFRCIPEAVRPLCRMNLCGTEVEDIRCKRGRIFHLQGARCYHGQRECISDVYKAIYRACEGQRTCVVKDLLQMLPLDVCYDKIIEQSNIFMDYICVDERVQNDNCTSRYMTLTPRFGILKSPGYPNNPLGNSMGCRWAIYPEVDQVVDLYIHQAYSMEGRDDCNYRFLQVQYTVCDTGLLKTDIFCDEGRINVKIHSCGTIFVMHWPYAAGELKGNRFLLSYHVTTPDSHTPAYVPYSFPCERIDPNDGGAKYTIPKQITVETTEDSQSTTERHILVDDQPVNDGNASKGGVQTASKAKNKTQRSDPWKMVTLLSRLKPSISGVVVVNIFLGLLIIALIMALIFVCYRYKTVGRRNKHNTTPASNTATTLDDKNSTELHPLQTEENRADGDKYDNVKSQQIVNVHNAETGELHEETTLTISPTYETTIFHFNREPDDHEDNLVPNSKSGISSFLPPSLNRNMKSKSTDNGQETKNLNQNLILHDKRDTFPGQNETSGASQSIVPNQEEIDKIHDSLHHYKVDDKEYAIVLRSPHRKRNISVKELESGIPENPDSQFMDQAYASIEDYSMGSNPQYCRTHIHPVPEDDYVTHTTMHMIPEHNCLLHKIPPPPPPVHKGYWGPP